MTNILQFKPKHQATAKPPIPDRKPFAVEDIFRSAHVYRVMLKDEKSSEELLEIAVNATRKGVDTIWLEGGTLVRHFDVVAIGESKDAMALLTRFYEWRYKA